MALGHLPALFALPAGLGDIAAGIAAPLVARRLAQGGGRRAALWFNAYAASHRPARGRRDAAYRCGGKPGIPCPMKYATRRRRQCKHDQPQLVADLLAAITSTQGQR